MCAGGADEAAAISESQLLDARGGCSGGGGGLSPVSSRQSSFSGRWHTRGSAAGGGGTDGVSSEDELGEAAAVAAVAAARREMHGRRSCYGLMSVSCIPALLTLSSIILGLASGGTMFLPVFLAEQVGAIGWGGAEGAETGARLWWVRGGPEGAEASAACGGGVWGGSGRGRGS